MNRKRIVLVLANFTLLLLIYLFSILYNFWEAESLVFGFSYANFGYLILNNNLVQNSIIHYILIGLNPIITIIIMFEYVSKYYKKNIFIPFFITFMIGLSSNMILTLIMIWNFIL